MYVEKIGDNKIYSGFSLYSDKTRNKIICVDILIQLMDYHQIRIVQCFVFSSLVVFCNFLLANPLNWHFFLSRLSLIDFELAGLFSTV